MYIFYMCTHIYVYIHIYTHVTFKVMRLPCRGPVPLMRVLGKSVHDLSMSKSN